MITLESSPAVTFAANEEKEVEEERDQKFQGQDLGELEKVLLQLHSRGDTWEAAWGDEDDVVRKHVSEKHRTRSDTLLVRGLNVILAFML